MGTGDSKQLSEQQQLYQQLQHQILLNQSNIQKMQIQNLQNNNINQAKYLQNNNYMDLNPNNFNPATILNDNKSKSDYIKTYKENLIKIQKLNQVIEQHKHIMTLEQIKKINNIIETLSTSNDIIKDKISSHSFDVNFNSNFNNNINSFNNSENNNNFNNSKSNNYNQSSLLINQGTIDINGKHLERHKQQNNLISLTKNFESEEEEAEARFKQQQERQRQQFIESQRQRRYQYQIKLQELERKNIDALKLFNLSNNYNLQQLKQAYRKMAIQTHPDRPSGSKEKFQLVTKCYLSLMEKYKLRESDKTYQNLREGSKQFIQSQKNNSVKPINGKIDKDNFNLKQFNKIYEQHKLWDPNDEGYDDWLKNDNDNSNETPLFSNKFNIDIFNTTFDNYKSNNNTQITEYKAPSALVSSNMSFTDIDNSNRVSDYSKPLEGTGKGVGYTDLKTAYTSKGNLINPNSVDYKTYNSVDELKRDRSKISYKMSPQQLRELEIQKRKEQEMEERRQERITQRDQMVATNYSKIHQQMLGY
mgnify:FL=1